MTNYKIVSKDNIQFILDSGNIDSEFNQFRYKY